MKTLRKKERGAVMVIVLMITFATMLIGLAGMVVSSTDLKITWNYKRSAMAFFAAEAGVQRAPEGYEARTVLRFAPCIAPYKVAVLPLLKNKEPLVEKARGLYEQLSKRWKCFYDQTGAIGRRYRRQDEIGTPLCITIDFDTIEKDDTVTIRDRDTMEQIRLSIAELEAHISNIVDF